MATDMEGSRHGIGRCVGRERNGAYALQVLDRVFDILDQLASGPATISDLSRTVGLHRSTAFRLLANLAARGYVRKDEAVGTYHLGMKLFHLGAKVLQERFPIDRLRPMLQDLADSTGYTSQLWLRSDHEAVCIDQIESPQDYRLVGRIGRRFPLNAGAVGKVLLAFAPSNVIDEVLAEPLTRVSVRTQTDPDQLRAELATIRSQGWATSTGELRLIARVFAAPVYGVIGHPELAVVVLIGKDDHGQQTLGETRRAVVDIATSMSQVLGHPARDKVKVV